MPRIPISGTVTDPLSYLTTIGTNPLGDSTDATYIEFDSNGDVGATIGIPAFTPTGGTISLGVRLQVILTDPTDFVGTGEFFIATDEGLANNEIAGFSDGSGAHFAFTFTAAQVGNVIGEVVVPLDLTPWGIGFGDVASALGAGAFLDINALRWVGGAYPPKFRVYEAWIEYATVSMVRQWPNDAGGLTTTPRLYPPPRNTRIYGGHH